MPLHSLVMQSVQWVLLRIWFSWWMALGVWEEKTLNSSGVSLGPWREPLTLERIRPEWLWCSTAQIPGQSSTWTSITGGLMSCEPLRICPTRVVIPWQVCKSCVGPGTTLVNINHPIRVWGLLVKAAGIGFGLKFEHIIVNLSCGNTCVKLEHHTIQNCS